MATGTRATARAAPNPPQQEGGANEPGPDPGVCPIPGVTIENNKDNGNCETID